MSPCIRISHGGHEIEFHEDEETGKHFRPGAGEGETKQESERERTHVANPRQTPGSNEACNESVSCVQADAE